MDSNGQYISITEASRISGKHIATIYKGIRKGRILAKDVEAGANTVKKVLKQDIIKIFGIAVEAHANTSEAMTNTVEAHANTSEAIGEYGRSLLKSDIRVEMKEVIEEFFETKQTQLMKPLEEQSIFIAGKLTQENQFLKQRLETILQENELLKEQLKALPDFQAEKDVYKSQLERLEKEKEDLLSKEDTIRKEKEEQNTQHMAEQQKQINELEKKEQKIKELDESHKQELEQLKKQAEEREARLKAETEEEKKQIAEAWKRELELAKKPWWKWW